MASLLPTDSFERGLMKQMINQYIDYRCSQFDVVSFLRSRAVQSRQSTDSTNFSIATKPNIMRICQRSVKTSVSQGRRGVGSIMLIERYTACNTNSENRVTSHVSVHLVYYIRRRMLQKQCHQLVEGFERVYNRRKSLILANSTIVGYMMSSGLFRPCHRTHHTALGC
jgi:hypothetical protein